MTPITATLHTPTLIRLDFAFSQVVNAKIKTIDGWAFVADGKFWTVPVKRLDDLVKAFGADLEIHQDVLDAKMSSDMARVRVFVDNLLAAGISLDMVDGRVTGSGGAYCADPWQKEIDKRADAIVSLGLQHSKAPEAVQQPAPMLDYAPVTPEVMRQAEMLVSGMHNAAANQYGEEAMRQRRLERRRKINTKVKS